MKEMEREREFQFPEWNAHQFVGIFSEKFCHNHVIVMNE